MITGGHSRATRSRRGPKACAILGLFLALGLTACTETQPTNLYMISGLSGNGVPALSTAKGPIIGVGPVSVPAYLDRPQIVTRASPNKLMVGEFDRWAEPIESLLSRVLSENLSVLLNSDTVFTLPRRRLSEVDIQVELEVFRFDAGSDGTVHLIGRWAVYTKGGKKLAAAKKTTILEPARQSLDYESVAVAMSQALERLSQEIAEVLKPLI